MEKSELSHIKRLPIEEWGEYQQKKMSSSVRILKYSSRTDKKGRIQKLYKIGVRNSAADEKTTHVLRDKFFAYCKKHRLEDANTALLTFLEQTHGRAIHELLNQKSGWGRLTELEQQVKDGEVDKIKILEDVDATTLHLGGEITRLQNQLGAAVIREKKIDHELETTRAKVTLLENQLNDIRSKSRSSASDQSQITQLKFELEKVRDEKNKAQESFDADCIRLMNAAGNMSKRVGVMRQRMIGHWERLQTNMNTVVALGRLIANKQESAITEMREYTTRLAGLLAEDDKKLKDVEDYFTNLRGGDFEKCMNPTPLPESWIDDLGLPSGDSGFNFNDCDLDPNLSIFGNTEDNEFLEKMGFD
jgi:hypothetical protein